jgi:hypothetical protein
MNERGRESTNGEGGGEEKVGIPRQVSSMLEQTKITEKADLNQHLQIKSQT